MKNILDIGKYKGQTVEFIAHNDPSYYIWLYEETERGKAMINPNDYWLVRDRYNDGVDDCVGIAEGVFGVEL